jgi:hypothetical protein
MKLNFVMERADEQTLVLRLGIGFRIVFFLLAGLVAYGSHLNGVFDRLRPALFPGGIMLLFLLIALYQELWRFSRREGRIVHAHGLLLFTRYYVYPLERVAAIEFRGFRRGGTGPDNLGQDRRFFQKDLTRLSIVLKDGERKDVRIEDRKSLDVVLAQGEEIARFLGLPLHDYRQAGGAADDRMV